MRAARTVLLMNRRSCNVPSNLGLVCWEVGRRWDATRLKDSLRRSYLPNLPYL
jgi:hypothetical protein